MKVVQEELPERQLLLQVEVEPEALGESLDKAYRRLASRANIPGFRKGKAPRPMVERYLGRDTILDEAIEMFLPQAYRQALAEQEVEAFAAPQIELVQREPLIFKATVPLRPIVELGPYQGIRMPPVAVEVTDEEVEAVVEQLRAGLATWDPVERPADFQDRLQMDVTGTKDGEPYLQQEGFAFIPVEGSMMPVPGFGEALVGMGAGDEKEFSLSFPADHEDPRLAGSEFGFKVGVHQVHQRQLPPLDDEFAPKMGEEYQTVEALREAIRKQLHENKEAEAQRRLENEVLDRVAAEAAVEFPPILVQEEVAHIFRDEDIRLRDQGDRLDLLLARVGKTEEELRAEVEPLARERVRRALVMGKVGEAEAIEVTEADLDAEVERMAEANPTQAEEVRWLFSQEAARHNLEHSVYNRKVLQRLVAIALQDETSAGGSAELAGEASAVPAPGEAAQGGAESEVAPVEVVSDQAVRRRRRK